MRTLKAIFLTGAVAVSLVLAGCTGDDDSDNNNNPDGGPVDPFDGSPGPGPGPGTDSGTDGAVNPLSSFPAYTKSLIDTQTADNTLPAPQATWDAIPDDETAATAGLLFPPAFFP